MIVYVGCAIDTARSETPPVEQFKEVTDLIARALPRCVMYNPLTAFVNAANLTDMDRMQMNFVIDMNMQALAVAKMAVFVWNGSPSYGVPVEIEACYKQKKRFVIWNRTPKKLGLYLRHRAVDGFGSIVDSEQDLIAALTQWATGIEIVGAKS